jgi:hypothetical protein
MTDAIGSGQHIEVEGKKKYADLASHFGEYHIERTIVSAKDYMGGR